MAKIACDPTYEDMAGYLNYQAGQNPQIGSDIKDLEAAIYFFARKYHHGIRTNLYDAMIKARHRPDPCHRSVADVGVAAHLLYNHLVGAFIEGV
jgi:hypothetical protein